MKNTYFLNPCNMVSVLILEYEGVVWKAYCNFRTNDDRIVFVATYLDVWAYRNHQMQKIDLGQKKLTFLCGLNGRLFCELYLVFTEI